MQPILGLAMDTEYRNELKDATGSIMKQYLNVDTQIKSIIKIIELEKFEDFEDKINVMKSKNKLRAVEI